MNIVTRIALVKTSQVIDEYYKITVNEVPVPPLGLMYIGECLRREGHNVKICDQESQGLSSQEVLNWIKKRDPEILGFGPYVQTLPMALNISKTAKDWNENLRVVFGNIIGTFADRQLLSNYQFIDYCLRREAELTFPQFVKMVTQSGNPKNVNGLTYRENGLIKRTPDPPLNRDLDALPIPDREALTDFDYKVGSNKYTLLASSRGCPFNCRFCAVGLVSNSRGLWRPRSLDNVLAELHFLQSRGFKELGFVDDDITINPKRTLKLCQRMRKEKIDMIWESESRVTHATKELLRTMRSAGCTSILFGIESGNQRVLDYLNKKITPLKSKLAVKNARKAGLENIAGLFIVGTPHETVSDIIQTMKFGLKLDLTLVIYQLLYLPIHSTLWQEAVRMGLINEDRDWNRKIYATDIFPDVVRREILEKLLEWVLSEFLSRPKFLLKEIFRSAKSSHRLQIAFDFLKK
ncbi:MAG: B12-binding domain-containing radical SAM protein [Candidatus Helarchaeota archaeon]|nr:B12-binding domain-containing radical SAM protein [Candidatus Helarchaeota archaeon]